MRVRTLVLTIFAFMLFTGQVDARRICPLLCVGKANAVWTPKTPAGLVAWYKANNDSTNVFSDTGCTTPQTTNNGVVNCWKDLSGHGYNLISGAASPTYVLAGLDSKPTIRFARAGQRLVTAPGVAMGTGTTISGFAEMFFNSQANFDQAFVYAPPAGNSNGPGGTFFAILNGVNPQIFGAKNNVGSGNISFGSFGTVGRFGYVNDGTNGTSYVNNTPGTSTANTDASVSAGCIAVSGGLNAGCGTTGTMLDGGMSELIIYNTALSASDRASLDAYLAARW